MPSRARTLLALAALAAAAGPGASRAGDDGPPASPASEPEGVFTPPADPTAPADPPPTGSPPPASAARPKYRWQRPALVPRWIGGGVAHARWKSSAPGVGTTDGRGWSLYFGWDLTRWLDAGFRGGAAVVRVGWTPNPSDTDSVAESGFGGVGLLAHLRHDRTVDPWIGLDLNYQAIVWNTYLHSIGGWGWVGSAGVDLRFVRWGVFRVGAAYSSFTGTTSSPYGPSYPTPQPYDDGATAGMQAFWMTAGWLFDLGPRPP